MLVCARGEGILAAQSLPRECNRTIAIPPPASSRPSGQSTLSTASRRLIAEVVVESTERFYFESEDGERHAAAGQDGWVDERRPAGGCPPVDGSSTGGTANGGDPPEDGFSTVTHYLSFEERGGVWRMSNMNDAVAPALTSAVRRGR